VLCAPETPTEVREKLDELSRAWDFTVVVVAHMLDYDTTALAHALEPFVTPGDEVITSQLDSDDALHPSFVAWAQDDFRRRADEYVSFPVGAQIDDHDAYLPIYLGSPFLSRRERAAPSVRSIYEVNHAHPRRFRPYLHWTSQPAWLQFVHGTNVANEVRGIWCAPKRLTAYFDTPASRRLTTEYSWRERAQRRASSVRRFLGIVRERNWRKP